MRKQTRDRFAFSERTKEMVRLSDLPASDEADTVLTQMPSLAARDPARVVVASRCVTGAGAALDANAGATERIAKASALFVTFALCSLAVDDQRAPGDAERQERAKKVGA
jgi:hypothetical protein